MFICSPTVVVTYTTNLLVTDITFNNCFQKYAIYVTDSQPYVKDYGELNIYKIPDKGVYIDLNNHGIIINGKKIT